MNDKGKTKKQLINGLAELRRRIAEMEASGTERKRAEEALRESEAKLRSMLQMANDAIISINSSGNITLWNKAAQEMFSYTKEDVLGKPLTMLMPERYRNAHQRGLERVRSTGVSGLAGKRVEFPGLRKDGSEFPFELSLARWEAGGETFYTGIICDITERKQLEQALMKSEQNFRSSMDNSPLGIRIITVKGELLYTNKATLDIYGYSSFEELKFIPAKQRYTPESYAEHEERKRKRKVGGPVPPSYEISIVRKTGEIRTLQVFRKEVVWGGKTQFQSLYQDITESENLKREVVKYEELDKLKSNLLSIVSHELRTPLAIIKGYATMLVRYDKRIGHNERNAYLRSIDRASERLVELIDRLLDMSRLEAGLLNLQKRPVRILPLLQDMVREAQLTAPGHNIMLETERRLPRLNIDARRIRQVLDNIVNNAVKYSKEGTGVVVQARRVESELLISIADQGIGIPAEDLPNVFDRMHRIERRQAQDIRGAGLGLAICKGLVEKHGGRIWVESEVGRGSTFYFTLPLNTKEKHGCDEEG